MKENTNVLCNALTTKFRDSVKSNPKGSFIFHTNSKGETVKELGEKMQVE